MKPSTAWGIIALAGGIAWLCLAGPPWAVIGLLSLALVFLRTGYVGILIFLASSVIINGALLGWLTPGDGWHFIVPISESGVRLGVVGALRVGAVVTANVALLQYIPIPAFLDGLRLPHRATGFLAAILISSRDLGQDLAAIREARMLDGEWPERRGAQLATMASLLPAMLMVAWRRAEQRREALRGAGISVGPRFAPIVAVSTLAIAGRLAFVALPNVALTYVIVFAGGIVFGARTGFWAGFWAMAITDLLISGFTPSVYVNAPAMGMLGLLGGWLSRTNLTDSSGRMLAAAVGIFGTLMFSLATDAATWALIPEYRTSIAQLQLRLLAGLAFNVPSAITNAVLFALAAGPVSRAAKWRPTSQTQPKAAA